MVDNTDLNNLIIETILIDPNEKAEFISRKLSEDFELTATMKEAIKLREQYIKGETN